MEKFSDSADGVLKIKTNTPFIERYSFITGLRFSEKQTALAKGEERINNETGKFTMHDKDNVKIAITDYSANHECISCIKKDYFFILEKNNELDCKSLISENSEKNS
jgi:hypothetical protein